MTIRTAAQLRENLKRITADNEQRLEKIRKQIDDTEARGGNAEALKKQLTQARTTAEKSEELAAKHLKAAEEREAKETQELEATRKRVSAEVEARQKFRAERAWIAAGGDPKAFATAWPSIHAKLLDEKAAEGATNQESRPLVLASGL